MHAMYVGSVLIYLQVVRINLDLQQLGLHT